MLFFYKQIPRINIFYYEWENTAKNHCGMAYWVKCLQRDIGLPIKLIKCPQNYGKWRHGYRRLWRKLLLLINSFGRTDKDIYFFMEYLGGKNSGDHRELALELRKQGAENRLIGMVHLPMDALRGLYDNQYIKDGFDALDDIVIFGSSLAVGIKELGYHNKVRLTFLYVDTEFYQPKDSKKSENEFTVIVMGFLYRNRGIMKDIILRCPDILFQLCLGNNEDLHSKFSSIPNVIVNRFMPEKELVKKMQQANVSLSVFDDTIGSNVITTSLACGLPQVVSDVGSIRDYCSGENTIFCQSVSDFVTVLHNIKNDKNRCLQMKKNARERAEQLSLEKSVMWHKELFKIT